MYIKQGKSISYVLLAPLLVLDVAIMLFEKIAANSALGEGVDYYLSLLCIPWTWLALFFAASQLWVWTKILSKTELSVAYPMSSFSYPLIVLAAQIFLGEKCSLKMWLGVLFITIGVALVGSKAKSFESSLN